MKSPSTEAAIRAVRDSRRSLRPGPELPNGRPFRYQGASPRQAPIGVGLRVTRVGRAELPADPGGSAATSMMVVLVSGKGGYDGVVYQFGMTASAQSPSMW